MAVGDAGSAAAVSLDHGFQTALYVLAGLLVGGALVSSALLRPAASERVPEGGYQPELIEEAA